MQIELGTTEELTNTKFGSLAVLMTYYQGQNLFDPLQSVTSATPKRDFSLADKLEQVVWSIMTGCKYLSEVNTKLRPERKLAQVKRSSHFAEQSTLALALNELTQMNLAQLGGAVSQISGRCSRIRQHDWRGFLRLDFDLSGLPCGQQAEGSRKGYFSGKKTSLDANWPVSVPSTTTKRPGLTCSQATI